jgi:hypothetical protein
MTKVSLFRAAQPSGRAAAGRRPWRILRTLPGADYVRCYNPEPMESRKPTKKSVGGVRRLGHATTVTSTGFRGLLPVCLSVAGLLVGCGQDEQRYVTDCRDAASRSTEFKKHWDKREIHYNRRDHGCYLSVEGSDSYGGDHLVRAEIVVDINENRNILHCSFAQKSGDPLDWLCLDREGESITRERFLQLRKQYLER